MPVELPSSVSFRYTCIAGMAEAAAAKKKFSSQSRRPHHYSNLAGAMAVKPSTWIQPARKPFGALTAPNVAAVFYLAAALAAHSQKGIPAFSIYGHDVQDADDNILLMLKKNCCAFAPVWPSPA